MITTNPSNMRLDLKHRVIIDVDNGSSLSAVQDSTRWSRARDSLKCDESLTVAGVECGPSS